MPREGPRGREAMTAAMTKRVLTVPACWHRDDKHPPHPKYLGCHPRDRLSVTGSARLELDAQPGSPPTSVPRHSAMNTIPRHEPTALSRKKGENETALHTSNRTRHHVPAEGPRRREHTAGLALGATQWPAPDPRPGRTHRPTSAALLTLYGPAVAIVRIHKWPRLLLSPSAPPPEQQVQGYDS